MATLLEGAPAVGASGGHVTPASMVHRLSGALARRTSRRGFLARTAVTASALAVSPAQLALRSGSAYAAVCSCSGSTCDCGSACCDGYTEFCCTTTGSNTCPDGTVAGGWWKADAPGLCGNAPRYYIDCNVAPGANPCSCGCAGGNCNNRKACCTRFRYGQCHQEIPTVGAIMCRVVTCTPPWVFDPSCTTAPLTDNATRNHDRHCLHDPAPVTRTLRTATWYLANAPLTGSADQVFKYGDPGDRPIAGDWNGDGRSSVGVFRNGRWYLANALGGGADVQFTFGDAGDLPIVGRWIQGDARHYPGVIRGTRWYLRMSQTSGPADVVINFGNPGDVPIVGDWNGDGADTPGVVRSGHWYLCDSLTSGVADRELIFGDANDTPIVGRWVAGDARHLPAVIRDTTWYLRNSQTGGGADVVFGFGDSGDLPLVGDWNGDGRDTIGVAR
jgi:hypothetical protein